MSTRLDWTPEQFAYHPNRLARSLRLAVPEIHPTTPWRWLAALYVPADGDLPGHASA